MGKKIEVLVENKMKKNQMYFGRNEYLNGVIFDGDEKFVGKTIKIKLKDKINDKKTFKAILKSVENDSLELNIGKEELTIDFGIIDMCKLMPNYKEILREKNGR